MQFRIKPLEVHHNDEKRIDRALQAVARCLHHSSAPLVHHRTEMYRRVSLRGEDLIPRSSTRKRICGHDHSDRCSTFSAGCQHRGINNGEVEWAKGYGVTEAGGTQAVTADTVFQAASVSKPVSVTGIMLLAQAGVIDITRNVNDYLTSWHLADNDLTTKNKATVQRLMSHTGGINVSGFAGYTVGSAIPTLLQVLNGAPPADTAPIRVIYEPGPIQLSGAAWKCAEMTKT